MKTCPEADHYEQCPNFRNKKCDAINCWVKFPWQVYAEHERRTRAAASEGSSTGSSRSSHRAAKK